MRLSGCIVASLHRCIVASLHRCIVASLPAFLHSCIPAFLHSCISAGIASCFLLNVLNVLNVLTVLNDFMCFLLCFFASFFIARTYSASLLLFFSRDKVMVSLLVSWIKCGGSSPSPAIFVCFCFPFCGFFFEPFFNFLIWVLNIYYLLIIL